MLITAFIFSDDKADSVTLMNHEYDEKCLRNETVAIKVSELKTKYLKFKMLSRREVELARWLGIYAVCEGKRDMARTITNWIQPIGDSCVEDNKKRKKFVLNTLLLVETTLDYFCGMNVSHVGSNPERCFANNARLLTSCASKSYNLFFWEQTPNKPPTMIQLLDGSVCK